VTGAQIGIFTTDIRSDTLRLGSGILDDLENSIIHPPNPDRTTYE